MCQAHSPKSHLYVLLRPLIKPTRVLAFESHLSIAHALLQGAPDFLVISIEPKLELFVLSRLNRRDRFDPRQVGGANRAVDNAVEVQAVIPNQTIDRQQKLPALFAF